MTWKEYLGQFGNQFQNCRYPLSGVILDTIDEKALATGLFTYNQAINTYYLGEYAKDAMSMGLIPLVILETNPDGHIESAKAVAIDASESQNLPEPLYTVREYLSLPKVKSKTMPWDSVVGDVIASVSIPDKAIARQILLICKQRWLPQLSDEDISEILDHVKENTTMIITTECIALTSDTIEMALSPQAFIALYHI